LSTRTIELSHFAVFFNNFVTFAACKIDKDSLIEEFRNQEVGVLRPRSQYLLQGINKTLPTLCGAIRHQNSFNLFLRFLLYFSTVNIDVIYRSPPGNKFPVS